MHEILLILGGMAVFYFLMVLVAVKIKEKTNKQICPICATVSLTWATLLILHLLEAFEIDHFLLATLMGASVCGVMYLVEKKIESAVRKVIWKIGSVLLGTFLVWGIVSHQSLTVLSPTVIFYLGLVFFSLKNKKESKENGENVQKEGGNEETWLKKLENCC